MKKFTKKVISITGSLFVVGSISITTTVVLIHQNQKSNDQIFWSFDNKTFDSQEKIFEYAKQNITFDPYKTSSDFYLTPESKTYGLNDFSVLTNDLTSTTPITEYQTYKNPTNFIVNNTNELSSGVLTPDNDELVTAFKGNDGNVYLDKQEAIETFENYQKIYRLGNSTDNSSAMVEFDNIVSANQYLDEFALPKLEQNTLTERYEQGGMEFTKDQIINLIRSNTDIEYEYNGYKWTSLSQPDRNQMQLTQEDENNYITPYVSFGNAYWLNLDTSGLAGTFSGPLYIESDDDLTTINSKLYNNWTKLSSTPVNALLYQFVLFSDLVSMGLNSLTDEGVAKWDIKEEFFRYFPVSEALGSDGITNFKNSLSKVLSDGTYDQLFEFVDSPNKNPADSVFKTINDKLNSFAGMSNWQKTLVFIQNLYNYLLVGNNLQNEAATSNFLNLLRLTLKNIITQNNHLFDDVIDALFPEQVLSQNGNPFGANDKSLTLTEIIHLFLNPNKFLYETPSAKVDFLKDIALTIQAVGDTIFDASNEVSKMIKDGKKLSNATKTDKTLESFKIIFEKSDQNYYMIEGKQVTKDEAFKIFSDTAQKGLVISEDGSKVALSEAKGLISKGVGFAKGFTKLFAQAKAIWDIGNILSPVKLTTFENDLGNGQILHYSSTEWQIPILDIAINDSSPSDDLDIQALSLFKGVKFEDDQKDEDLYVVFGSLFVGLEPAQAYLKQYITQHPWEFESVKAAYMSLLSQQEREVISNDLINDDKSINKTSKITSYLEQFVNRIFEKYYANKTIKMYFDGIDQFFSNQIDAKNSLQKKIEQNQLVVKYKFIDDLGMAHYFDSEDQAKQAQDGYVENYKLESKQILKSDLVSNIRYDEIATQLGTTNPIYGIVFNGMAHYFNTKDAALYYIYRNSHIQIKSIETTTYNVTFKEQTFKTEVDFYLWVRQSIKAVNRQGEVMSNG